MIENKTQQIASPHNFFLRILATFFQIIRQWLTQLRLWRWRVIGPRLGLLQQYPPRRLQLSLCSPISTISSLKISLVTPSYNQGKFLERTIQSVLSQNYQPLEYIIQDGGSEDESPTIIEKFRQQCHHVFIGKDKGQANAINLGFRYASGEIMAWLNSDDILLPYALSYISNYFYNHPDVDVVYGLRIQIDEHDQEIGRWILPPYDPIPLTFVDYIPQETLFWRRSIWEKVGGYLDESFHFALDWDLILRFQKAGAKFVRLPRFLGAFRIHNTQKTSEYLHTTGYKESSQIRIKIHGHEPNTQETRKAIHSFLWRSLWYEIRYRILGKLH